MRVLWFEVNEPSGYRESGDVFGGWQDSLEKIVSRYTNIELFVAFATEKGKGVKQCGNVTYIPVNFQLSLIERIKSYYSCRIETQYFLPQALSVVNNVKPDIIHVFGLEWPWGLIAEKTETPLVIHIMGSMLPYYNALYPPKYNLKTIINGLLFNFRDLCWNVSFDRLQRDRREREYKIWEMVGNYMGRTDWDFALSHVLHPDCKYYHVEEAIRDIFLQEDKTWSPPHNKIKIISTGTRTYWKGPDMLLKTAKILKEIGLDFEWNVIGGMRPSIQKVVEKVERIKYEDCGVKIWGFKKAEELRELLLESTLYVHTAYIENSPNSICEAQCLGLPIVSTNVGGISTLVSDGEDGLLVPANDPWQMAYAIKSLVNNVERMMSFSRTAKERALKRHNPQNVLNGLLTCYNDLIKESV